MAVKELKDGRWIVYYRVPGKKSKKREYFGRGLEGQRKDYVYGHARDDWKTSSVYFNCVSD